MIAGYRPSEDEIALAAFMGGAWGGLARDGVPVVPGGPSWPIYAPATDPPLVLEGGDLHAAEGVRTDDCDFWDTLASGEVGRTMP